MCCANHDARTQCGCGNCGVFSLRPRNRRTQVQLLSIPCYQQGHFDGLCAYYTGAMMLAALYPQFDREFGELTRRPSGRGRRRVEDPLIRLYKGDYRKPRAGSDDRYVLARWYYEGEYLETVKNTLNRVMKEEGYKTRFDCEKRTAHDSTFRNIASSIDEGLPVMLGWHTEDFGNHAVLVTGYWHGKNDWLLINDPGGDQQICWQNLKRDKKENFEVVTCNPEKHRGPRPDMVVTEGGEDTIYRWTPVPEGGTDYMELDTLFQA